MVNKVFINSFDHYFWYLNVIYEINKILIEYAQCQRLVVPYCV